MGLAKAHLLSATLTITLCTSSLPPDPSTPAGSGTYVTQSVHTAPAQAPVLGRPTTPKTPLVVSWIWVVRAGLALGLGSDGEEEGETLMLKVAFERGEVWMYIADPRDRGLLASW